MRYSTLHDLASCAVVALCIALPTFAAAQSEPAGESAAQAESPTAAPRDEGRPDRSDTDPTRELRPIEEHEAPPPIEIPVDPLEEPVLALEMTRELERELLEPFGHRMFDIAPSAFAPPVGVPVGADYTLGPDDELTIHLWNNALLVRLLEETTADQAEPLSDTRTVYSTAVSPQGTVFFPRIGVISVLGLSIGEVEEHLRRRLSQYYEGVQVGVTLAQLRSMSVFVMGEVRRPGNYVVNSLTTVFNALYVAGGPNRRGSMRSIRLSRGGTVVDTIDLYSYLLAGDDAQDYRLEAGDAIFVPPMSSRVAVVGEVLRPAIYELARETTLQGALDMAGGLLPTALTQRIQIDRVRNDRDVLLDFNAAVVEAGTDEDLTLQNGDTIFVFSLSGVYENRVTVAGNVYQPGVYQWRPGLRLSDVIGSADGVKELTHMTRVEVHRLRDDSLREVLSADLTAALSGDPTADLVLANRDQVFVYALDTVNTTPVVTIAGEVSDPNEFPLAPQGRVSDLVFKAKGVNARTAYLERADLFRIAADGSLTVIPVSLHRALSGDKEADILLRDEDELVVYNKDDIGMVPFVEVRGAVELPGVLTLAEGMTLKDALFMAGGLTMSAYTLRAEVVRTLPTGKMEVIPFSPHALVVQNRADSDLLLQNFDTVVIYTRQQAERTPLVSIFGEVRFSGAYELHQGMTLSDVVYRAGGVKSSAYLPAVEVVRRTAEGVELLSVDLRLALAGDPEQNVTMLEDDQVYVRRVPDWTMGDKITITGEAMFPGDYNIMEHETLAAVLDRAGGLTPHAYPGGIRVERLVEAVPQYGLIHDNMRQLFKATQREWLLDVSHLVGTTDTEQIESALEWTAGLTELAEETDPSEATSPEAIDASELRVDGTVPAPLAAEAVESSDILPKSGEYIYISVEHGRMSDLVLEHGDIVIIPKSWPYILVVGAVYNPGAFPYQDGRKVEDYVELAGGYTEFAEEDARLVVKANGSSVTEDLDDVALNGGDMIIVPSRLTRTEESVWSRIRDLTSVVASAVTIGLVVVQLSRN